MSSRQLRKLQKQKDLENVGHESESDEADEIPTAKPRVSAFAALGGDDDDDQDEQDEIEEPTEPQPQISEATATGAKKSKKKKKKKKAKAPEEVPEEDEDEIDKAIKELKISTQNAGSTSAQADQTRTDIFNINPYHLKAINEMRNLFGREVIESANTEEEDQHRQRRVPQQVDLETYLRAPRGAPKLSEVSLRRNVFIQGKEHWPRASAGGLTMKEVQKGDGWTEYTYAHDKEYDRVQCLFFASVQIGDPMRMVHLAKEFREYSDLIHTSLC